MSPLQERTHNLKSYLKNAKSYGRDAWFAGKYLSEILEIDLKEEENNFTKYRESEFGISHATAQKYIKVYKSFESIEEIPDDILVTHLYLLTETDKNIRMKVLDIIIEKRNEGKYKRYKVFSGNDIKELIGTLETTNFQEYKDEDIKKEFDKIIEKNKSERGKGNKGDSRGERIESEFFEEIIQIFPYEPITEQGLVGLFCIMFHLLRKKEFEHKRRTLCFHSIEYIRTKYPDSRIAAKNIKNNRFELLNTEFELKSSNFIAHGHHNNINERCDLIICWEDNIDKNKISKNINIPPILSIKELFEKGKMNVVTVNKNIY